MKWTVLNKKTKKKQECLNKDAIKTLKRDDNFDIKEVKEKKIPEANGGE